MLRVSRHVPFGFYATATLADICREQAVVGTNLTEVANTGNYITNADCHTDTRGTAIYI
jgi:hypothetical protein